MGVMNDGRIITDLRWALAAGDITSLRRVLYRVNSSNKNLGNNTLCSRLDKYCFTPHAADASAASIAGNVTYVNNMGFSNIV